MVTSGTMSPTLGIPIAMAYVPTREAEPGTILECGVRETRIAVAVRAAAVLPAHHLAGRSLARGGP